MGSLTHTAVFEGVGVGGGGGGGGGGGEEKSQYYSLPNPHPSPFLSLSSIPLPLKSKMAAIIFARPFVTLETNESCKCFSMRRHMLVLRSMTCLI